MIEGLVIGLVVGLVVAGLLWRFARYRPEEPASLEGGEAREAIKAAIERRSP